MYELVFDEQAIEFLGKLEKPIKDRIFKKVLQTKENPFHYFEGLTGREDYKLRVGGYRIIADINQNTKTIRITFVGHRKNVYDKI